MVDRVVDSMMTGWCAAGFTEKLIERLTENASLRDSLSGSLSGRFIVVGVVD